MIIGNARPRARRFYFQHIGKTAGTTLRNHLIKHLGEDNVAPMIRRMSFRDALLEYGRFDAITGHIAAKPGDGLPSDRICITLLRDPVDRALSEFGFRRTIHASGVRKAEFADQGFDEWIADLSESDIVTLNAHVESLWPFGWEDQSIPRLEQKIAAAKRTLDRLDFVGIQQWLHESIAILDFRIGWPAPDSLPVDNATPSRIASGDLTPATRARSQEVLAPDIELFEYAQRCFAEQRRQVLIEASRLCATASPERGSVDNEGSAARFGRDDTREEENLQDRSSRECGTREITIGSVSVSGDISGSGFVQTGEWVTVRVLLHAAIDETNLTAGIAIRDHSGALVFGINTAKMGNTLAVGPGDYAVSFGFPNTLGIGRYSVTAAIHRGATHLEGCFHWWEAACWFEVADSVTEPFEGRMRLHVEARAEALTPSSRIAISDVTGGNHAPAATIGHRNPALRDFRAELRALDQPKEARRASDGVVTLRVMNSGEASWSAYGRHSVRVSHHWLAPSGNTLMFDGLRTALPHDIEPGQSVRLKCFFRAPDEEGPATLVWTLVQEEIAWFDERDPESRLMQDVSVVT